MQHTGIETAQTECRRDNRCPGCSICGKKGKENKIEEWLLWKGGDGEAIEVHDLTVAYRDKPALWDIDLTVPPGVLVGVVGPNGAGKTTLLKSMLGLIRPVSGEVLIHGQPYEANKQAVAYVPQRGSVDWDFPTTVFDVVLMGTYGQLGWFRRPGVLQKEATTEALQKVGMAEFADRQIRQLSGGQQQRVFLARALVQQAPVYFMDEPFQGVDAVTERAVVDLLRDGGRTVALRKLGSETYAVEDIETGEALAPEMESEAAPLALIRSGGG